MTARERAAGVAKALAARFGDRVPEDARTLVSFWLASERGAERAAKQLIEFASALGVDAGVRTDGEGHEGAGSGAVVALHHEGGSQVAPDATGGGAHGRASPESRDARGDAGARAGDRSGA